MVKNCTSPVVFKPKGLFLKGMVMYYGLIVLSNKIIAETVEIIKMIWI